MTALLVMAALGAALFGIALASNATAGVAVISIGILCAVLARIAQAADHQKELRRLLSTADAPPRPEAPGQGDALRCPHCREVAGVAGHPAPAACPHCGREMP